ncbi:MAG TPA: TonB family protein [Novimethylophilus sp.]|jgi:protein TonB|uniref:TonB family protein n=1 Tax=Novimethylophilus sp. TaxID=2137426 RepID=UPI002F400596
MNFAQQQRNPGKHLMGITFVAAFHVLIVWALLTGLAQKVVEVVKVPLETKIIQEIKPPPPPAPPPPSPKLAAPPPPFIPPPDIVVATPPPANTIRVTTSVAPPEPVTMVPTAPPSPTSVTPVAAPSASSAPREPVRIAPVIDAKQACEEPEYPSASRRNEEQGTVVLRFLIDVDGRVIDSKIATSSGFSRLDRAARDTLSHCVFKPGTLDGKPEQSWANIRYTWHLN